MKKTFCDRCNEATEEVKRSEHVVEDYEKSDGSGKGPRLMMDIVIENFDTKEDKPDFCKTCFEQIIVDLLKSKKPEEPKPATTSTEEDIPF